MEFPDLGSHCTVNTCKKLDFLPVKCDACLGIFCSEHMTYSSHQCKIAAQKDVQVPVCPLCNQPVPIKRGELPDYAVGLHIDNNCKSDTALGRRNKIFTNKCSMRGCKGKELIPVKCYQCTSNFCLKHRHPNDHKCEGHAAARNKALESAQARLRQQQASAPKRLNRSEIQGNINEDEALARALQLSMQDTPTHQNSISKGCRLS